MDSFLVLLLFVAACSVQTGTALDIYMPERCKTEGRVTLIQPHNNQIMKHHLPFTETIDMKGERSTISIGYVSYPPVKYFARKNSPLLTVDSKGRCISHDDRLVSTLSWFVKQMFPQSLDSMGLNAVLVGPTSLIHLIQKLKSGTEVTEQRAAVHRNIPCTVYVFQKVIADDTTLVAEYYVPTELVFNSLRTTFFSVKASTYNTADPGRLSSANMLRATYVVDYYFIDDATSDEEKFDRLMRQDFNVPLAAGCSKYLKQLTPDVTKQSFSMSYKQMSTLSLQMLAYDHSSGLLRKERVGESVSVWDLREDLLYHVDADSSRSMGLMSDSKVDVRACSVTKVTDDKLGPAFKPYDKLGEPIDVLKLIGAQAVSYMGSGWVRDLPCSIYETIVEEPPTIFALTAEQLKRQSSAARKYIVQFYLLEADRSRSSTGSANEERLPATGFWPAQIDLYRQYEDAETGSTVELIDQLEVYDFFWSLDGWSKKNNELFMASECFDDANKQLRLEMALTFDQIHSGQSTRDVTLLTYNKFKLEYDLIDDIFRLFEVSKMHLVSYEMKLRPSHVDMRVRIADRTLDMELVYFGEGDFVDDKAYAENRVSLSAAAQTEETCISMASLVSDISMVVYCPFYMERGSSCTAVYDEPEPVFKNQLSTDSQEPTCHVYRFKPSTLPKQALGNVLSRKQQLYKRAFNFNARVIGRDEGKLVELTGHIQDFELTHDIQLITIDHHSFVMPPDEAIEEDKSKQLRSFDSIDYKTPNDCERICNLDTNCRSYSYCKADKRCILSSLDIRSSYLESQLVNTEPVEDATTKRKVATVNDGRNGDQHHHHEYRLALEDNCFVYERNYLSYYKQTDEVISLDRVLAKQFPLAPSTFYCAKMSIDVEASGGAEHHVAMFAYCESTNVCILDENLFEPIANGTSKALVQQPDGAGASVDEMSCRIYRKRYQTYFKISSRVLKPEPDQQLSLRLNTVEECARACWIRFGTVCASFDFCTPGACVINKGSASELGDDKLETRGGCLHYERDLELDKLREKHLIGRHQILERGSGAKTASGGSLARTLLNLLTYALAFGAFIYGLALGRKVNDKMEQVTISRQSVSAAAVAAAAAVGGQADAFDYQSFPLEDEGAPTGANNQNVIKMNVISNNDSGHH